MIELAPGHKQGLPVDVPVLLAGGTIGYGEAVPTGLEVNKLGGVVIGPLAASPHTGHAPPRMASTNGGVVLGTGGQTRGVKAAIRKFARGWPRLGVPVVGQIVDTDPSAAVSTARALMRCEAVAGIELVAVDDPARLKALIRSVTRAADLPLWIKLPLENALALADVALDGGAHALVVGQPQLAHWPGDRTTVGGDGKMVRGALYGPLAYVPMMTTLAELAQAELGVPLIACGGIHTAEQMMQALALGAQAIQVDSGVWVEPALPNWLAAAWENERLAAKGT